MKLREQFKTLALLERHLETNLWEVVGRCGLDMDKWEHENDLSDLKEGGYFWAGLSTESKMYSAQPSCLFLVKLNIMPH